MKKHVGNKNFSNVFPFLMNKIPKSERYFSLFFGGGGIENSEELKNCNWVASEIDKDVVKAYDIYNFVKYKSYQYLLYKNVLHGSDFVFCDPPYLLSKRKNRNIYYKYEFFYEDHIDFLNYVGQLNSKVLITHPKCDLYDEKLKGWYCEKFEYMTRNGIFKDALYTNYNTAGIELLNYNFLGKDFIERQATKRQRKNIVRKFEKMDFQTLDAIMRELKIKKII